ncbi:hypothetical protein Pint_33030 [Pistacia integerrima]|uniref:Uncharacterized protein n=1 Tax=Pistacia integerrima TaxID=434235 RepID=A0ACC0X686_9ROSI|nr:hypothetical protein Pint_33030 [Pistacia integerrima]
MSFKVKESLLRTTELLGSGKKQDITITGTSTLPTEEVEKMVQEAERFAQEDKEKRDTTDTKNQADSVVQQTEKQLKFRLQSKRRLGQN